jgi:hypothetical protein
MLKSEGVAEAKRAAAESLPTFPIRVHQSFAWLRIIVARVDYPTRSCCSLQIVMSVDCHFPSHLRLSYRIASESKESAS